MKSVIILLSCLSIFQSTLWAKQVQKESLPCGQNHTQKIAQGDKKALKEYIEECRKKPNETLLKQYQIQKYTTLQATSLVCMGDYYATRITHLSYLAYTLAAKQESLAAKVSLGMMLNEPQFKNKLPLNTLQEHDFTDLAFKPHPYNHYETLLELRSLSNKKERKLYLKKDRINRIKYATNCILSLEVDLKVSQKTTKDYKHIKERKRNHNTELWADTEFHFAKTKQQRLEKVLKMFKTVTLSK